MPIILNPYQFGPSVVLKGYSYAAGSTIAIPTHAVGDLIIIAAYRQGNSKASMPGTYTAISTPAGANNFSSVAGYLFAASSGETSGTWTSALNMAVLVYSGVSAVGATSAGQSATSTMTWPALTLQVTDGTSWVAMLGAATAGTPSTPSGVVSRGSGSTGSTVGQRSVDTDSGVSSWSSRTSAAGSSVWESLSIELKV